jgi:hypothetical protein
MRKTTLVAVVGVALAGCNGATEPVSAVARLTAAPLSVVLGPPAGEVDVCGQLQLTTAVHDSTGALVIPDSTEWWSSDTTVLWISPTGLIHARKAALADTTRATVWRGGATGTGQSIWDVSDARNIIVPCPTNGSPAGCAPPCPPGF